MRLGYNTSGFADHRLADALAVLHEIGYRSAAITLDHPLLHPPDRSASAECIARIRSALRTSPMHVTVETGARFILDPRRKHQPTLISASVPQRRRRLEYLKAAIDVAAGVGADCVSFWSGAADDGAGEDELFKRLVEGLGELLVHAEAAGVRLAFEPEPGMFIDTMARYARLIEMIQHPLLGLTLDVGHVHCLADGQLAEHVDRWGERLWNVHIEDMRRGLHEHLMFGEGEIDFAAVFAALKSVEYAGPVHVELPRHRHNAVETARKAFAFLTGYLA